MESKNVIVKENYNSDNMDNILQIESIDGAEFENIDDNENANAVVTVDVGGQADVLVQMNDNLLTLQVCLIVLICGVGACLGAKLFSLFVDGWR